MWRQAAVHIRDREGTASLCTHKRCVQAYGKELGDAWECTEKYKKTRRETELHQVGCCAC